MHQCLQISETLSAILEHVGDRASFARVATACRAFHEPAIGRLWYALDDLRPLVLLLPKEYVGKNETESLLTILNKPCDDDWDAYDRYASHVRELRFIHPVAEDGSPLYVARECYAKLLCFYPASRGHPLPHLTSAAWTIRSQWPRLEHPDLRVLVRPTLRSFSWTHLQQTSTLYLLEDLKSCGAALHELQILTLPTIRTTHLVQKRISRFICSLSRLRTLRVPSLLPLTVKHLASLNTLEELSFQIMNEDYTQILQPSCHQIPVFISLRYLSLKICTEELTSLISFIRALPRAGLEHIKITYSGRYSDVLTSPTPHTVPPDIHHLEEIISMVATFETLRTVALQLDPSLSHAEDSPCTITGAVLLPLYSNKHLTKLIVTRIGCQITTATFADMLRAWPAMTTLILGQHLSWYTYPLFDNSECPTAEEIFPLCAQHGALQRLHVHVRLSAAITGGGLSSSVEMAESNLKELVLYYLENGGLRLCRVQR